MHMSPLKFFNLIFIFILHFVLCFSWWPFSQSNDRPVNNENPKHDFNGFGNDLAPVPFEMKSAEEKFLQEAQKFGIQFSEQNICHHKIILHLRKSCGSMTEEDIGKLSVQLLNCQSSVEGRKTYRCTMEMSLADCTKDMDANTWNAYHIISNRARSVCYATRQQQFAAKTEITVNKLVWAAENQIDSMNKLQETQEQVSKLTGETLSTMSAGQKDLMIQQDRLRLTQSQIQTYVAGNLRELTREKALISAGQKELAGMTEAIRQKLDEASKELEKQETDRRTNHKEILNDLAVLQKEAQAAWSKIDNSTKRVLMQHEEAVLRYQETLENLQRINSTVNYLLTLINETRVEVDKKIGWLADLVDGTGVQLSVMYTGFLHAVYFIMAAIIAAFLHLPNIMRMTLVCLVPLNAITCINETKCLDFPSLTTLIIFIGLAYWMLCTAGYTMGKVSQIRSTYVSRKFLTFRKEEKKVDKHEAEPIHSESEGSNCERTETNSIQEARTEMVHRYLTLYQDNMNDDVSSRASTPVRTLDDSHISSPLNLLRSRRASTPSRKSCSGKNKHGRRCKLGCVEGHDYCRIHQPMFEDD